MNKFLFLLTFAFLLFACKNEKSEDEDNTNSENEETKVELDINNPDLKEIPSLRKCYTLNNDETEAQLNLVLEEDDFVTGQLYFRDETSRSGSVTGEFSGDTLILAYKFRENNQTKVEELIFLENKKDYTLKMGSADLVEQNEFKTIKDRRKVKFSGPVFKKLDCEQ